VSTTNGLARGCEREQFVGNRERIEQQQPRTVVDRVGGHFLRPYLAGLPVGMRRLPVPETWLKLVQPES
jgi:hypothetical protein